jgi:hypothetical protein
MSQWFLYKEEHRAQHSNKQTNKQTNSKQQHLTNYYHYTLHSQDKKKKMNAATEMNNYKTTNLLSKWESQAEEQQQHHNEHQHLAWHELGRARRELNGQEEARVKSKQVAALARFVAASRHRSFGRKA